MRNLQKIGSESKDSIDKISESALTHWILKDFLFDETGKDFEVEKDFNMAENKDVNYMLGVTVSTVMHLARGNSGCPSDHLKCTCKFLKNIKNDTGRNPHNVASILDIIEAFQSKNINY